MACNCFLNFIGLFVILFGLSLFLLKINLHRISNAHKVILFEFLIFSTASLSWPYMIFRPKDYRNISIPFACLRLGGKFLGFEVELRGKENLKPNHGGVVIMNHQSTLDLLQLGYLWPLLGRAKIVVKKSLLFYPFFGIVLWLSGFLFINRTKNSKAINKLNEETVVIQQDNYKLLIFPEGTRTLTEKFLEFRRGAFYIAIRSQCPIQPIVFSHYHFLKRGTPFSTTLRNRIIISILPEIKTDVEFKTEDKINDLIELCQNEMQIEYTKISAEINSKSH